MKTIAILAVQGAFAEHERIFRSLGANTLQIRKLSDLSLPFDALVLPGGESTAQSKLIRELGMFEILKQKISDGLPVFATCAGAILLAKRLVNDSMNHFGTLDISIHRNGYGRQLSSFCHIGDFEKMTELPMSFIRAPRITDIGKNVEVLAKFNDEVTAVRQGNQWAMTFHPELSDDFRCHELFLKQL